MASINGAAICQTSKKLFVYVCNAAVPVFGTGIVLLCGRNRLNKKTSKHTMSECGYVMLHTDDRNMNDSSNTYLFSSSLSRIPYVPHGDNPVHEPGYKQLQFALLRRCGTKT